MRLAWRVTLFLWAVYLVTYGGGPHSVDEISQLGVVASLVERGSLDVNEQFWTIAAAGDRSDAQVEIGPTGDVWSVRGPTIPLLMAPWHALALWLPSLDMSFTALLCMTLVSAAVGGLLTWLGLRLGLSERFAGAAALLYGLGTLAWPYSRTAFGEPAIALAVVLAAAVGPASALGAAVAGLALVAAVAAKPSAGLLLAPLGLYAALACPCGHIRRRGPAASSLLPLGEGQGEGCSAVFIRSWQGPLTRAAAFAGAALFGLALLGWHNWARYGSPLTTGYGLGGREQFSTPPLVGLFGLLLSPYRGVIWFVPLVLAALLVVRPACRRAPAFVALALAVAAITVATYAPWRMWWGGAAWGPRFLLPALPLLVVLVPLAWPSLGRWARSVVVMLIAASVLAQLPGTVTDFNVFEKALQGRFPDYPRVGPLASWETSPLIGNLAWLARDGVCALDLTWIGCDRFDPLLGGLLVLAAAGAALALVLRRTSVDALAGLGVVVALSVLLVRGPSPPVGASADLLAAAEARAAVARAGGATIVLASPEVPVLWARDRWSGPIYGLNRDDLLNLPESERLLELAVRRHDRLWLLASNVPRDDPLNAVERWLVRRAFPVDEREFGAARLRLFLTAPSASEPAGGPLATFAAAGDLELSSARLLDDRVSSTEPGRVELGWRGRNLDLRDLAVFVHLYEGGRLIGQSDTALAVAAEEEADVADYTGVLVGRYAPRLRDSVGAGMATVEVGVYRRSDGARLAAHDRDGRPFPESRVPVGRLTTGQG